MHSQANSQVPRSKQRRLLKMPMKEFREHLMVIYENYLWLNILFYIQTKHSVRQQLNGLSQWIRYEFHPGIACCLSSIQYKPIQALEHPTFHKMVNIAAQATNGVTILN